MLVVAVAIQYQSCIKPLYKIMYGKKSIIQRYNYFLEKIFMIKLFVLWSLSFWFWKNDFVTRILSTPTYYPFIYDFMRNIDKAVSHFRGKRISKEIIAWHLILQIYNKNLTDRRKSPIFLFILKNTTIWIDGRNFKWS